jgi:hypothetical protein
MTGVPLIWLAYISASAATGSSGTSVAQLSAIATAELLDWLPIFSEPSARNFLAPDSINDRFFTMLVFIHIGVPLLLILGLWAHVQSHQPRRLPAVAARDAGHMAILRPGAAQAGAQQPAGQSGDRGPAHSISTGSSCSFIR